jgi:hypothetical protein
VDVAKVDRDVASVQRHVASVCSKYFICFETYVCKRFDLDVAYVSHMLQEYVPMVFSCFSIML